MSGLYSYRKSRWPILEPIGQSRENRVIKTGQVQIQITKSKKYKVIQWKLIRLKSKSQVTAR